MKTLVFVFVFSFGDADFPHASVNENKGKAACSRNLFREHRCAVSCEHVTVYKAPEILGDLSPSVVCEQCGKRWGNAGSIYLEQGDAEAIAKQKEYEKQLRRAR